MLETSEPAISLGACQASGKPFVATRLRLRFLFTGHKGCPPLDGEAAWPLASVAAPAAPPDST
eukprot:535321-Alexandrium_andersonii.AAC.1